MTDDTRQTRREHLHSIGAGASSLTLAALAPTTKAGVLGWEAPDNAVSHSDDRYGWIIPVEGNDPDERAENLDALEDELSSYDNTTILSDRRHDGAGSLTAVAPVDAIGARNRDRWLVDRGIATLEYIDETGIEINRTVSLAEPLRPAGEAAWEDFGVLESTLLSAFADGVPQPDGIAFDDDMVETSMVAAREATAATDADTTLPDTSGVTVAVGDTGVTNAGYLDDADGNTRLRSDSKNFVDEGDPEGVDATTDGNGHGDWIAACYAARTPEDTALEGFLPDADVLGIKVLTDGGSGSLDDIAAGIRYTADVADAGTVLNLSLGSPQFSQAIENALEYAVSEGIIPVAAAGNDRQATRWVAYPASSEYTISVGSTTVTIPDEALSAYYSNTAPHNGVTDGSGGATTGAEIDVGAPGCKLESASGDTLTGTSMAGPVAGCVTLLDVAAGNTDDLETARDRLTTYAEPIQAAATEEVGAGMPSAANLLSETEPENDQDDVATDEATTRGAAYRTMSGSWLFRQVD
ncbi:S8 family serine peptidase [Halomontanus rarus]|uniref:S8 family serine peptidase n=1 Tax=Halomontanus rarus TaxID=3034020 RepID=UPI0023E8377C|nr:S8 family serine peptidase [Halovivax sp. TS33]